MASPVPVIVALRHPLVAVGVRSVLADCEDIQVLAECSTLAGALRAVRRYYPRVLVAGSGICDGQHGALETLRRASPETRLALLCTHAEHLPEHALLQGASAVLPLETDPEQLVDCIRALAAGRRWRSPVRSQAQRTRMRTAWRTTSPSILAALSVRERQIAQGIASGKRNREIAEAFGIAPGTVKLHLNRIYSKLGVNSRLALLRKLVTEANFPA